MKKEEPVIETTATPEPANVEEQLRQALRQVSAALIDLANQINKAAQ